MAASSVVALTGEDNIYARMLPALPAAELW